MLTVSGSLNYQSGTHANRLLATPAKNALWKETDTGLVYIGDGSAWQVFNARGQVIKTADETVNNSAAVQNDDHLFFPIEANERWLVQAHLILNAASVNADWLFGWSGPAGATADWRPAFQGAWVGVSAASAELASLPIGSTANLGAAVGNHVVLIEGIFLASAAAGNINLQWAQNTATAENSKVLTGSSLLLQRLG